MKRRCFIAIGIPEDVKSRIKKSELYFRDNLQGLKIVSVKNMHLTLNFLGYLTKGIVEDVLNICHKITAFSNSKKNTGFIEKLNSMGQIKRQAPFVFKLKNFGVFPLPARPRILWIGINADKRLFEFQYMLHNALSNLQGLKLEAREYRPHLTIGRFRKKLSEKEIKWLKKELTVPQSFGCVKAESINLMESVLTPKGAEYSVIKKFML